MSDLHTTFNLEPRSDAERAYVRLRRDLLNGEWLPLERLRPSDLQERLSLGITPIREALTRLAVDGLVQGGSQRGFRARGVSAEELSDLMSTRRELERACLQRAIQHGDAGWEAAIIAAMHMLSRTPFPKSAKDRAAAELWEVRHRGFHYALVSACGSAWRLRFWATLTDHSERYRMLRLLHHKEKAAMVRDAAGDHRAIMEAVLARDAVRAGDLMDEHLTATEHAIRRLLLTAPQRAAKSGR